MSSPTQTRHNHSPVETLRSPLFWLLYFMMALVAAGGLMATAQLAPIAYEYKVAGVPVSLLVALVRAGGRIVTRDVLLDQLYGKAEADVLDRTVDVYVRRLRDKLGDDPDEPRYVATVRGAGYRAMIDP